MISSTRRVIERHLEALLAGDADGLLATFADDAAVIGPEGPVTSRHELRLGCERLVAGLFAPGTSRFTLDSLTTHGEIGLVTWHAACDGTDIPFATETFVVRDGVIAAHAFAAVFEER